MTDPTDLDAVFGPLRGAATADELVGRAEAVDAMTHVLVESNDRMSIMKVSRRTRVATLIAVGVIGFGGVAAAGPGGFIGNDDADIADVDTVTTEAEQPVTTEAEQAVTTEAAPTTATEVPTPPEAEAVSEPEEAQNPTESTEQAAGSEFALVDDPATVFDETMCLPGNHGATVSAVARGELVIDGIDVTDAAHSSCGKTHGAEESDDDGDVGDSETTVLEEESATEESPAEETSEAPGESAEHGNSTARGNSAEHGTSTSHGAGQGNGKNKHKDD